MHEQQTRAMHVCETQWIIERNTQYAILNMQYVVDESMNHWDAVHIMKYSIRWRQYMIRNMQVFWSINDWKQKYGDTVNSLCNDCFDYQQICPYIKLSLLRGTTAVRVQWLLTNGIVLTSRLSLHWVSLQIKFTVRTDISETQNSCLNWNSRSLKMGSGAVSKRLAMWGCTFSKSRSSWEINEQQGKSIVRQTHLK